MSNIAENPFAGIGQQFAPVAPQEAPAPVQQFAQAPTQVAQVPGQFAQAPTPQFAPAPVQQAAPAFAPQAVQQYAPQAPAAPAPVGPAITPSVTAPDPRTAGAAAFGSSRPASSGEKHHIKDFMGQPLLLRIHEVFTYVDKKNPQRQPSEVARVDWIVLDPNAPVVITDAWVFSSLVVRDLKETLEKGMKYHTGRVKEVPTTFGSLAPALDALTEQENNFAVQAGSALGWW